jgi:hypothetical protein
MQPVNKEGKRGGFNADNNDLSEMGSPIEDSNVDHGGESVLN